MMEWAIDTFTKNWIWQIPFIVGLLVGYFIREIIDVLPNLKKTGDKK